MEVTHYLLQDGTAPFERWFDSLGSKAAVKVRTALARMELGNFGDHKSVGNGVWERRIDFASGYRIYYALDGIHLVILFCGGTKSRQSADIARAKQYWTDYKTRKRQMSEAAGPWNKPDDKKRKT
jgi:putative addiction module killer protein